MATPRPDAPGCCQNSICSTAPPTALRGSEDQCPPISQGTCPAAGTGATAAASGACPAAAMMSRVTCRQTKCGSAAAASERQLLYAMHARINGRSRRDAESHSLSAASAGRAPFYVSSCWQQPLRSTPTPRSCARLQLCAASCSDSVSGMQSARDLGARPARTGEEKERHDMASTSSAARPCLQLPGAAAGLAGAARREPERVCARA